MDHLDQSHDPNAGFSLGGSFALRIAAGDVPPSLQDVSLRSLDVGLLQAGASMKGEFEQRLRSVIEEKTNRIAEVMVSTVRSSHLMLGKIVGVGSAALLQVGVWIGAVVLLTTQSSILERLGVRYCIGGSVAPPEVTTMRKAGKSRASFFVSSSEACANST